jgi:hypothetical protein
MTYSSGEIGAAKSDGALAVTAVAIKEPPNAWFAWLEAWRIGDHLGILGLVLSIAGLCLTYREARKSRTAAEAAKVAAEETRHVRQLIDISLELNSIQEHLAELKQTVISNDWTSVAGRIDSLCQALGNARLEMGYSTNSQFTEEECRSLSEVVTRLRGFEASIARKGAVPPSKPRGQAQLHEQVVGPLSTLIDTVGELRHKAKFLSASR